MDKKVKKQEVSNKIIELASKKLGIDDSLPGLDFIKENRFDTFDHDYIDIHTNFSEDEEPGYAFIFCHPGVLIPKNFMVKVFDDLDIKIEQFITELERERDRGLGVMMRTLMKYLDEKNIKAIIFQAKYNRGIIDFNRAEEHSYVKGAFTSAWNVDRKSDIANTIIQKNKQAQDKMREKLLYYEESLKKIIHLHTMDKFLGGITRPAMQVITGDKTQDFIDVSKEDVNNLLSQINPILKDIDPTFEMAINFPYKNDLSVIKASSIGREVLSEHKPNWVIEFRKDIVNENIVQKVLAVLTRKS